MPTIHQEICAGDQDVACACDEPQTAEERVTSLAQKLKGMSERDNYLAMIGVTRGLQELASGLYEITPDKLADLLQDAIAAAKLAELSRSQVAAQ